MKQVYITERTYYALGALLIVATLAARYLLYPVVSWDYIGSVSHWLDALRSPGLSAFKNPFSDYAPLYLYFLKLITTIPVYELYSVKTLSVICDIGIAFTGVAILKRVSSHVYTRAQQFLFFTIFLAIPTVVLNSSAWAQADSVYTLFTVLSLYFIVREKPWAAAFMFGIALSLKLQAIFFLPVLIGFLIARRHNLWTLVSIPVVYVLSIIPAWLGGGSLSDLLFVYARQSGEYQALTLSAPTIFSFVNPNLTGGIASFLSALGVLIALAAAVGLIVWIARSGRDQAFVHKTFILFSLVSVIVLPFFLPHMHERYFYLADVISVLYAIAVPRRWYVAVFVVTSSLFSYMPFLSGSLPSLSRLITGEYIWGIVMLVALICLLPDFVRTFRSARIPETSHTFGNNY